MKVLAKLTLVFVVGTIGLFAQALGSAWTRTYGGSGPDYGRSIQQTDDGGYIVTGYTRSYGAGEYDIYLIKTDSTGDTLWTKTYGGVESDYSYAVQQTTDGGYIIAGNTKSFGSGGYDVYLIGTNPSGDTLWTKTYGGTNNDYGRSLQKTSDGEYIIAGETYSFVGVGWSNVYLIKIDSFGDTLWTKTYGGNGGGGADGYSVQQTSDGGYIITGVKEGSGLGNNVYLIKTDPSGDSLWAKTYDRAGDSDLGYSVQQTSDGGYIIAGYTYGVGVGWSNVYLIKTNSSGDTLWTKTYGGSDYDKGRSVQQTSDGGYIVTGETESFGAGSEDVYLIKTNSFGDTLWTKTYGGGYSDYGYSVQQTTDGGYIVAGYTDSYGAGEYDIYLIKVNSEGGCVDDLITINGINLSPINTEDLEANLVTDRFDVVAQLANAESYNLENVEIKCYIDGGLLPYEMGIYDSNGDGKLDELPANSTVTRKLAYKDNLPSSWENKELLIKITEIDGSPSNIEYTNPISVYYAKSEGGSGHPYSLTTDAYSFKNFGFNWKSWKDWSTVNNIDPSVFLIELFLKKWGNTVGRCYGMSATSSVYFHDSTNKPSGLISTPTYEMDSSNTSVMQYINNYQASQANENFSSAAPQIVYDSIKNHIINHKTPMLLLFKGGEYVHAVLTYKLIEDLSQNKGYAYIYENSVDPPFYTSGRFYLTPGTFNYDSYNEVQQFVPNKVTPDDIAVLIDNILLNGLSELWTGVKSMFGLACPARMLITDTLGRNVGYINDTTQVNEIPGAEIHMYDWDEGDSVSIYYIPADLKCTVEYFGLDAGEMNAEILTPKSDTSAKYYKYHGINIDSNTIANIEYSSTSDYALRVDYDGDTQIDTTILPDTGTAAGIKEKEKDKDKEKVLEVTQNLFMEMAQVQVQGVELPVTLNVYDVTGRIREKAMIYNSSPVKIGSNLTPGIYFVSVKGFESVKITKLR